jgi:hypothetical protein
VRGLMATDEDGRLAAGPKDHHGAVGMVEAPEHYGQGGDGRGETEKAPMKRETTTWTSGREWDSTAALLLCS